MELIIATGNQHKIAEFQQIIPTHIDLLSSKEVGITEDIEETETTLEGNALLKAKYIFKKTNKACFADDTGLFVEELEGEPGIYSARYAQKNGEDKTKDQSKDNIELLLKRLEGKTNRKAYFKTVIALIDQQGKEHLFEGIVKGKITTQNSGHQGFGYDPVFKPEGYTQSFAEITAEQKNQISHRARAAAKLLDYLNSLK